MNMDVQRALDELRKAVIDQKKASLPLEPADPSLAKLHQAVGNYDRLVSQLVMQIMQDLEPQVSPQELEQGQAELNRQFADADTQSNPKISLYRRYAERLDHMLALVEKVRQ